jgi:CAAX protease family protein
VIAVEPGLNSGLSRSHVADWKAYTIPFGVLIALLAVRPYLDINPLLTQPLRALAVLTALLAFSRGVIRLRPAAPVSSILLGLAVFAIWVGPDALFPGFRHFWLFDNALTRSSTGSLPAPALRTGGWFLFYRLGGSIILVPIAEELFWRAWLMRRLISPRFEKVALGTYGAEAFWLTAVLFASEHGAYWDVGLAAGILYNWWMIRTKSLADCILAHAVTNAALAVYVLMGHQWQYWS